MIVENLYKLFDFFLFLKATTICSLVLVKTMYIEESKKVMYPKLMNFSIETMFW